MKKQRGITLIALIITIIVMLILVGVTVNVALNGGLFDAAKEASKQTDIARIEEEIQVALLASIEKDGKIIASKLVQKLEKIEGLEVVGYVEGDTLITVRYVDKVQEIDTETGESIETIIPEKVEDEYPGDISDNGTREGSESSPYMINSMEDLVAFSEKVDMGETYEGKTIKLGYNLNFNSSNSYINPSLPYTSKEQNQEIDINEDGITSSIKTEVTTGKGFNSIGAIDGESLASFKGTFDGNGKTISNLYMYVTDLSNEDTVLSSSLFALNDGIIRNLGVIISRKSSMVAGIVGFNGALNNEATIKNCYCRLESGSTLGSGIVFNNSGTIESCYSNGNTKAFSEIRYCNAEWLETT